MRNSLKCFLGVFIVIFLSYIFFCSFLLMIFFLLKSSIFFYSKITPYECGFSPNIMPQVSFSIHYYMLLFVFVVFDLELVFLLGFVMSLGLTPFLFLIFFIFILTSYYIEVFLGSMFWCS